MASSPPMRAGVFPLHVASEAMHQLAPGRVAPRVKVTDRLPTGVREPQHRRAVARPESREGNSRGSRETRSVVLALALALAISRTTGEAPRVIGIAGSAIPSDLRIDAKWSRQADGARRRGIVDVLGGDHPVRSNSVLDPSFERCLDVVNRIARRRDLLPDPSEARRTGPEITVSHSGNHEQPIELLRPAEPTHGLDNRLVILGAVSGLERLVVPSVILDDLHASSPRRRKIGLDRVALNADSRIGIGHVAVEIEGAVVPVLILK